MKSKGTAVAIEGGGKKRMVLFTLISRSPNTSLQALYQTTPRGELRRGREREREAKRHPRPNFSFKYSWFMRSLEKVGRGALARFSFSLLLRSHRGASTRQKKSAPSPKRTKKGNSLRDWGLCALLSPSFSSSCLLSSISSPAPRPGDFVRCVCERARRQSRK